ncbi:hypothetical protein D3C77_28950 [compost metagenome]
MSEHSVFSFSGSHRWFEGHCPASIRMSRGYPEQTNDAAERGTAAHALGEFVLSLGFNINDTLGLVFNDHKVDYKMIDDVSVYTSYVNQQSLKYGTKPLLEQRVVMSSLGREDVYGTSDCNFLVPEQGIIEVADYKNGYGVVEVKDNPQTIGYAIAALDTFKMWDQVHTIKNTIIQPNGNHIDGPIRSALYPISVMPEWQDRYRRSVALAEDKTQKPNAGSHCFYCRAQANCRARIEYVLEHAYLNVPFEELSVPELEVIYREIGSTKKFLEKVEERVFNLALKGRKFEGFKVVRSYGRATCQNEDALVQDAHGAGVDTSLMFHTKLKSKTDLKRILPAKMVDKHFVSPEPGKKLVPMHDNSPAIRITSASEAFADYKLPSGE